MKSDLEFAIESAKKLESALGRNFGAAGRGLHEKIDSVATQLDSRTVRDLRYIATIRNRIVHEDTTAAIDDRRKFTEAVERVMVAVSPPPPPPKEPYEARSRETSHETQYPVPAAPESRFSEFEEYRGIASVTLAILLFVVAALFKLPFIIVLGIAAIGAFLGYTFGAFLAGAATVILSISYGIGIIVVIFSILYGLYCLFVGK